MLLIRDEIVGVGLALPSLKNGIIVQGMASRPPTKSNIEVYTAAGRLGTIARSNEAAAPRKKIRNLRANAHGQRDPIHDRVRDVKVKVAVITLHHGHPGHGQKAALLPQSLLHQPTTNIIGSLSDVLSLLAVAKSLNEK
jgi:hypothetical protein